MPEETIADTHSMVVVGAGGTAAGEAEISTPGIVLPAGGPFTIFSVFSTLVAATGTAGEAYGDYFRLDAASGDLTPSPQPSRFPTGIAGSVLGATVDAICCPTVIQDVEYEAAGKSALKFWLNNATALTVAPQVVLGIIFGKTRPVLKPFKFVDRVRVQVTAAALTAVGTLTISEKASKIVAVCGVIAQDNVLTTAEELIGFFSLASDDVKLPPAQFPFTAGYSAGIGVLINQSIKPVPLWIPVDIPIVGGARIDCSVDLNTAVTNGAEVQIFIAFE
jgi:hypothetical protein